MKITKVEVTNFRTLLSSKVETSNLSIFVGQNNHGKTNFFEALRWFFNGPLRGEALDQVKHRNHQTENIVVDVTFSGAQDGLKNMRAENNRSSIARVIGEADEVILRRKSSDIKKRFFVIDGEEKSSPVGFDNAVNDFLPKFEYIETRTYHDDYVKYGKNSPIASMLSGVLEKLLENDDKYKEFKLKFDELFNSSDSQIKTELDSLSLKVKVFLEKQFPDCTKVEFEVANPEFEDLLKNFSTTIDDGVITSVDEKGDGLQRAVMLAILQTFAEYRKNNEDAGKNFIFVIDEAELHLHPRAQRNLKRALNDLQENGDQVLISTHSSVFITDDYSDQTIFCVEKIKNVTEITPISSSQKAGIIFDLLGGSPGDLLLPPNFLIVEGHSDHKFIESIIQRFYPDRPTIQIVAAGGDFNSQEKSFNAINLAYVPIGVSSPVYKERVVILHDKVADDRKADYEKFKSGYPHLATNGQLIELPQNSIEEYYPDTWKKTGEEVKAMSHEAKQELAKRAGMGVSKEEFESVMGKIYEALEKAWKEAYGATP